MSREPNDLRWKDGPPASDELQQQAQELFRSVSPAQPLSPAALNEVWAQLAPVVAGSAAVGLGAAAGAKAGLHALVKWKLLVAVATTAVGGGTVATVLYLRRATAPVPVLSSTSSPQAVEPAEVAQAPSADLPDSDAVGGSGERGGQAGAGPSGDRSAPDVAMRAPARAAPSRSPSRSNRRHGQATQQGLAPSAFPAPRTAEAVESPEAQDTLGAESQVLGLAVKQLRVASDPGAALATLDEYHERFPRGALAREARVTRVDALLALGRRSQVLAALDGIELQGLPRGAELRVLRGELLAEAERYSAATRDFDVALNAPSSPALQERALYGRALCRAALGDIEGSKSDLTTYLERYPAGRFAGEARKALAR